MPEQDNWKEEFDKLYKELIKNAIVVTGTSGYVYSTIPTNQILKLKPFIESLLSSFRERGITE